MDTAVEETPQSASRWTPKDGGTVEQRVTVGNFAFLAGGAIGGIGLFGAGALKSIGGNKAWLACGAALGAAALLGGSILSDKHPQTRTFTGSRMSYEAYNRSLSASGWHDTPSMTKVMANGVG